VLEGVKPQRMRRAAIPGKRDADETGGEAGTGGRRDRQMITHTDDKIKVPPCLSHPSLT
jgi:hypothetical protein